jgi:hypothetical protein
MLIMVEGIICGRTILIGIEHTVFILSLLCRTLSWWKIRIDLIQNIARISRRIEISIMMVINIIFLAC